MSLRSNHGFEYLCQTELQSRQQNQGYINILLYTLKSYLCFELYVYNAWSKRWALFHYSTLHFLTIFKFYNLYFDLLEDFHFKAEIIYNPERHKTCERKAREMKEELWFKICNMMFDTDLHDPCITKCSFLMWVELVFSCCYCKTFLCECFTVLDVDKSKSTMVISTNME